MEQINKNSKNKVILHVSRPDSLAGGAAAFRTHKACLDAGYDSIMLVRESLFDSGPDIIKVLNSYQVKWRKILEKAERKFNTYLRFSRINTISKYYFFGISESKQYFSTNRILKKVKRKPDVIIFYFVDGFLNYKNIFEIYQATGADIYIYPMDLGPVTGGCHYSWDCNGFHVSCSSCPAIVEKSKKKLAVKNLALKLEFVQKMPLQVLVASEWLEQNISKSYLFSDKIRHKLFLPVDKELFRQYSEEEITSFLGMKKQKKIIFFGAQSLNDERKGMSFLLEALKILAKQLHQSTLKDEILLLIAGRENKQFLAELPFEYKFIGLINNQIELPVAYSAADVFACPSIQDAGPMMINEALMAGTPVVAFNMGIAMDLVHNNVTGYKAKLKDPADFAYGIRSILEKSEHEYMSLRMACREYAMEKISSDRIFNNLESICFSNEDSNS